MTLRTVFALLGAFLLIFLTFWSVSWIEESTADLAKDLDYAIEALQTENSTEATRAFSDFSQKFSGKRAFLSLFVSDTRIHEVEVSSAKVQRMLGEEEFAMALENLQELKENVLEIYAAFVVSGENIF